MKSTRAAIRYAKALLLESIEKNSLEETYSDMILIKKTFTDNIELRHMTDSLVIKNSIKRSTLNLIFKDAGNLCLSLINVLFENNRMNLIDIIAEKYLKLYKDFKGIQSATVTSAVPINEEIEIEILETISKLTNKKTTLIKNVDKSLIGGFVLRLGDIQYNASFKNKLKNIKQEFNNNTNLSII